MTNEHRSQQPTRVPARPNAGEAVTTPSGRHDPVTGELPETGSGSKPLPVIGHYQVILELGRGGMGLVYLARDLTLPREVALKLMSPEMAGQKEMRRRFLREARAMAELKHEHIVGVLEVSEDKGRPFIALEYIKGRSLDRLLHPGKDQSELPLRDALELLRQVALGLHHAHLNGVVHRDVKPANVLVGKDGKARVADFGLAFMAGEGRSRLTAAGEMMGTPHYMAPEQWRDAASVGPAADQYALGAMLYEALTGATPFQGKDSRALGDAVQREEPSPPRARRKALHRDLEVICLKALHKDPARRYASCLDLAEDLRRFLNIEPIAARPAGLAERLVKWARRKPALSSALGLILLLGLLLVGFLIKRSMDEAGLVRDKARQIAGLLDQADADLAAGRHLPAIKGYQAVLGLDRDQAEALRKLPQAEEAMRQEGRKEHEARLQVWMDLQQLGDVERLPDLKRLDAYIAAVTALAEAAPVPHEDVYYRRALALTFRNEIQPARVDLDRALELSEGHGSARYLRLKLAICADQRDQAQADLDYLDRHHPQDNMTIMARLLLNASPKNSYSQELKSQLQAIDLPDAYFLLALCTATSDYFQFSPSFLKSIQTEGIRISVLFRQMDVSKVMGLLDACLEREPLHLLARQMRGSIRLIYLADFHGALQDFDRCLQVAPDMEQALNDRAEAHSSLGELEAARADYAHLVEMHPTKQTYRRALAIVLMTQMRLEEARKILDELVRTGGGGGEEDAISTLLHKGISAALLGDVEVCRASLDEAITKWDGGAQILEGLSLLKTAFGSEAERILRRQDEASDYFLLSPRRKGEVRQVAAIIEKTLRKVLEHKQGQLDRMSAAVIALESMSLFGQEVELWRYGNEDRQAVYRNVTEVSRKTEVDLLSLLGLLRYLSWAIHAEILELQDAPATPSAAWIRATRRFLSGKLDAAQSDLEQALAREPQAPRLALALATVLAARAVAPDTDKTQAIALRHEARLALVRARALHWQNLDWLRDDPDFAGLVRYKGFERFLDEVR